MNRRQFLALLALSSLAHAQNAPTAADQAAAIAAVRAYLELLRAKDYEGLYDRHFHSKVKATTTKEEFVKILRGGFAETLEKLFVAILAAHEKKELRFGTEGGVPGTIALEIKQEKKPAYDEEAKAIKPGSAFRLQVAPDPKDLKFYDVD